MDIKQRLQELMDERGWTMYRLAKEAGVSWSTIRNIFNRGTEPSISTLEVLCQGLGISLVQFLDVNSTHGLTKEQQMILREWNSLDAQSKEAVHQMIKALMKHK